MKELDNILMRDIPIILSKQTAPAKYYSLISGLNDFLECLTGLDITDKYAYYEAATDISRLSCKTHAEESYLKLFCAFLHLYDYKKRVLADFTRDNAEFNAVLKEHDIKNSYDYITACARVGTIGLSRELGVDEKATKSALNMCDLMRLPGVKGIRGGLYYDCGYRDTRAFSTGEVEKMQADIAAYIENNGLTLAVPLKKELATQIAVAQVLPRIQG